MSHASVNGVLLKPPPERFVFHVRRKTLKEKKTCSISIPISHRILNGKSFGIVIKVTLNATMWSTLIFCCEIQLFHPLGRNPLGFSSALFLLLLSVASAGFNNDHFPFCPKKLFQLSMSIYLRIYVPLAFTTHRASDQMERIHFNLLILFQTLCFGYSLESSRRDDSNEYPQHRI